MANKLFGETKIISFYLEKGGCGKSLLTNVIANEIIFHFAKLGKKINVCILELDAQRTLGRRREENLKLLKYDLQSEEYLNLDQDTQKEVRQLQRSYLFLQQKFNFMSYAIKTIDTLSLKESKNAIDWIMSGDYDLVLLDFPGNTQQEGTADFFQLLTHLFIPIVARPSETDGIISFFERVTIPANIQTHFLLNKDSPQYTSVQKDICSALTNAYSYPILESSMRETIFFEKDTILPASVSINQRTLEMNPFPIMKCAAEVAAEVIKIIKNS